MVLARAHYEAALYQVVDVSQSQPFDLVCTKGDQVVRVEVKGTRGGGGHVHLTIGEVRSAREGGVRTDLFVVSGIALTIEETSVTCAGGMTNVIGSWLPLDEHLAVTDYRYRVPPG